MSDDPRRTIIMSADGVTSAASPLYPDHDAGAVALTAGTGYNASETVGDSVFSAGESVEILHARLDKKTTGQMTIHEGASGGTEEVMVLSSVGGTADAKITTPFYLPGGFHIVIDTGTCTFEIAYRIVPDAD